MEYEFKLTIEEYSTVLKFITELDKGKVFIKKLLDKIVIGIYLSIGITIWIFRSFSHFLNFSIIVGVMVAAYFFFTTPNQLDKKRVKLVRKSVKKNPDILGVQSVKIDEDEISYHYNHLCITTKIVDISRLIECNEILIVVGFNDNVVAVIPYSCFHSEHDKQQLKNKLLN